MAKYVVHKKGFFYTDEAFEEVEHVKGTLIKIFDTVEKAKEEKEHQDIISIQRLEGMNVVDFFFYSDNYDQVFENLQNYYKSEFGIVISDKYWFEFPKNTSEEQAKELLDILQISFHNIVEYSDETDFSSIKSDFDEQDLDQQELGEF